MSLEDRDDDVFLDQLTYKDIGMEYSRLRKELTSCKELIQQMDRFTGSHCIKKPNDSGQYVSVYFDEEPRNTIPLLGEQEDNA